jgi:RNA polymerase sigma factor (sigma-70 family)
VTRGAPSGSARAVLSPEQQEIVRRSTVVARQARWFAACGASLDYDELVSAGNEEVVRAVLRYDPSLGVPFDQYAFTAVRFAMIKRMNAEWRELEARALGRAQLGASELLDDARAEGDVLNETEVQAQGQLHSLSDGLAAAFASGYLGALERDEGEDAMIAKLSHARALATLRGVMDTLPGHRRVVELRDLEGHDWDAVAAQLEKSSATVRRDHAEAMRLIGARMRSLAPAGT